MKLSPRWQDGDKWLKATQTAELLSVNRKELEALMKQPFDPLPQPFPFGKTRRWLASQVWAWMERRMNYEPDAILVREQLAHANEVAGQSCTSPAEELRQLYESGATLDAICRSKKIGKARLIRLLRAQGASLRSPGRPRAGSQPGVGGQL